MPTGLEEASGLEPVEVIVLKLPTWKALGCRGGFVIEKDSLPFM